MRDKEFGSEEMVGGVQISVCNRKFVFDGEETSNTRNHWNRFSKKYIWSNQFAETKKSCERRKGRVGEKHEWISFSHKERMIQ